jgi:hypothetical protein
LAEVYVRLEIEAKHGLELRGFNFLDSIFFFIFMSQYMNKLFFPHCEIHLSSRPLAIHVDLLASTLKRVVGRCRMRRSAGGEGRDWPVLATYWT